MSLDLLFFLHCLKMPKEDFLPKKSLLVEKSVKNVPPSSETEQEKLINAIINGQDKETAALTEKEPTWSLMYMDDLVLIPSDAAIFHKKVPKYKEVKHYIKGEKLGSGKFGTVREFVDKYTLKRYAGELSTFSLKN